MAAGCGSADHADFAAGFVALAVGDEVEVKAGGGFVAGIGFEVPGDRIVGRAEGCDKAPGNRKNFHGDIAGELVKGDEGRFVPLP